MDTHKAPSCSTLGVRGERKVSVKKPVATRVLVHREPPLTHEEVRNTLNNHWICNFKSKVASLVLKMEKGNFETQRR